MLRGEELNFRCAAEACDEALAKAVSELIDVERSTGWERVRRVVEVLHRYFYAQKADTANSLAPNYASLRRLTAHPLCPFSKTRLAEMLNAFAAYTSESSELCAQLSPSHVAVVASLHPAERSSFLERAVRENLSVRNLRDLARAARREQGERRGRPPSSMIAKAVVRLENALLLLDEAAEILTVAEELSEPKNELEAILVELGCCLERNVALVHACGDWPRSSGLARRAAS